MENIDIGPSEDLFAGAAGKKESSSDEDSSEEEESKPAAKKPVAKRTPAKKQESSCEDSSDEEMPAVAPVVKKPPVAGQKRKQESSDSSDDSSRVLLMIRISLYGILNKRTTREIFEVATEPFFTAYKLQKSLLKLLPQSDVNKEYYIQNIDNELAKTDGTQAAGTVGKSLAASEMLSKLARTAPYYKRNRPHICSFWVKGECKRGEECPYRHDKPNEPDKAKHSGQDRPPLRAHSRTAATLSKCIEPE